ncbi:hypothetical protein AL036_08670 [Salipiger aestuarii]|uniref:hypothetical protein n=1 Tax=Salipiger aestuarii TaxID=568098 RepID=UPI00025B6429|nr:hypothetical protein [Salipiger aestuarii]EIE51821.1 hypothetical protein C357_06714 [Citreicella sp. 357]KAA8608032.1 hypothetical protein AL036_08670 [Salipiger aestuarii]KAB2542120.1 hypothetical protein AL035_08640 [Salipiger aestuarii]
MDAVVEQVAVLSPNEKAGLDPERLEGLYERLGAQEGEDVLCRAMEELAYRLGQADRLYEKADFAGMRQCTRALGAIAEQIGMSALARISGDVVQCIDDSDPVGLAATLARMARVGERSLYAVWDLQDLTV